MQIYIFISFFILLINFVYCKINYSDYKLYNVVPLERFQLKFLQGLEDQKYLNVVFWTRPFRLYEAIQILVSPNDDDLFKERLQHFNLKGTLLSENIQNLFEKQKIRRYVRRKLDTFSWDAYHDLEGVYQWMTDITTLYSDKASLSTIGRSAEGREILALEVKNIKAAKTVIVEGGIHGNEWVTAEFVTYLAYQLLNAEKTLNTKLKEVSKKFNWILIPIVNPDGYDYTMKSDRLWRKNRRHVGNGIYGVNLDRNFDYSFCKFGGSNNPSNEYYCGPHAFSEPETKELSQFINFNKQNLKYYFSIHAYGQNVILPYADRIKHIDNFLEMENYGKQAILKMYKLHGVKYRIGTIYDVYGYRASGDSVSWIKNTYRTK